MSPAVLDIERWCQGKVVVGDRSGDGGETILAIAYISCGNKETAAKANLTDIFSARAPAHKFLLQQTTPTYKPQCTVALYPPCYVSTS